MDLVIKRCCGQTLLCLREGDGVASVKCPTCGREIRFPVFGYRGEYFAANRQELEKQAEEWNKGVITIGR